MFSSRAQFVFSILVGMLLTTTTAQGVEPTEDMRTLARMFATLEARDLKGYCMEMHDAPSYTDYLSRACQSAVQNKLKQPEDCSPENIAQLIKADKEKCLAMPAAEFEKTMLRGREGSEAFIKDMAAQGIDGERLLQEERARKR